MSKVSIIIPARGEKFVNLVSTLDSVCENATGEFEIIVGINGSSDIFDPDTEANIFSYGKKSKVNLDGNFKVINFPKNVGIKTNINALAATATGKYLFKLDAHCSVGKGFDEILKADMQEDWIVMPRFYVLDGETWEWQDERFYDYFYLCCPFTDPKGFRFKAGGHWPERTAERLTTLIDETPQIHGSGWFMTKDRFFELGGFPLTDPYGHGQEPLWLGLRNWLMGGKVMVNKKTWYAHLHQNSSQRGYPEDKAQTERTYKLTAEHFVGDRGNYLHSFEWFLDKFELMPSWPENWRELLDKWQSENELGVLAEIEKAYVGEELLYGDFQDIKKRRELGKAI